MRRDPITNRMFRFSTIQEFPDEIVKKLKLLFEEDGSGSALTDAQKRCVFEVISGVFDHFGNAKLDARYVGVNVFRIRKKYKLSQAKMSPILGIHQSAVSRLEKGVQELSIEQALILKRMFGVTLEQLTSEDGVKLSGDAVDDVEEEDAENKV